MVKEEGNPGNLAALPTMMDFLDTVTGANRLVELNPPLRNTWRTCHSNSCHTTLGQKTRDGANKRIFPPCTIGLRVYTDFKAKITNGF
jgi:hypothetical protein